MDNKKAKTFHVMLSQLQGGSFKVDVDDTYTGDDLKLIGMKHLGIQKNQVALVY